MLEDKYSRGRAEWLTSATVAFLGFSVMFLLTPKLVTRLLKPYATLTYRNDKDRDSSGGRYVTFTHAVIVAALNFYMLFTGTLYAGNGPQKGDMDALWPTSTLANVSLGISLGYFLLDVFVVAWYLPAMGGKAMLIHHIAAFLSVLATVSEQCVQFYTLMLLATEVTTPFINFRWLLEKLQWKQTRLYKANGLLLVVSWFLARVVLFVFLFSHLFHRREQIPHIPLPVRTPLLTVPPTLAVLNTIWFSKILKGAMKVFGKGSTTVSKEKVQHQKANGKAY